MAGLKDLYQDIILDHYRKPRNFRSIAGANRVAEAANALCGDRLRVFLLIDQGIIRDMSFTGNGCAIAIASASIMTESLRGKAESEAVHALERFFQFVSQGTESAPGPCPVGDLAAFRGLRGYPVRVKCATLPWTALRSALEGRPETGAAE